MSEPRPSPRPVSLEALNAAADAEFVRALDGIFEHAAWVAEGAASRRPFPGLRALHDALLQVVAESGEARQLALIRNHPELAGRAAAERKLTAESAGEQSFAGLDQLSAAEYERFHALNRAYGQSFGFPFILCVRRHSKPSILDEFQRRLAHDASTERATALTEIGRIAALRLHERVSGPDPLPVTGRLSTHVLDTHAGRPAAGMRIELFEVGGETMHLVSRAVTNADGRTDAPLVSGRPLPIGLYELRFHAGEYYEGAGVAATRPAFLDIVPIRFGIAEAEGAYHVPLLLTPWSYTSYRGS